MYQNATRRFCQLLLLLLMASQSVSAQLTANFSLDKTGGCAPLVVNFTNQTSGASANTVYQWDFGNGNHSSLVNGGAIYNDEQTYTVTLTVTDGANQSSHTETVTVYKTPVANFSVAPAKTCLGAPVVFSSSSTPGSGTISSYAWDFGDGSTAIGSTSVQSYTYATMTTASVGLTVTNNFGCHASVTKPNIVTIIQALNANFSADKKVLCLVTDPIQFINASNGPGSLSYTWDFGDGSSSNQQNPQHIFNKKGFYNVQLTVHSSEGCTQVYQQSNPINVASYSTSFDIPAPICNGSTVVFNNTSAPAADNSVWSLDGTPQYAFGNLGYTFYTSGNHTVSLANTFGTCPQSASKTVSIKDIPVATAFLSTITGKCGSPVPVNFKDLTPDAVKWEWDFNYNYNYPQISSTLQAPSFTYTSDGTFNVFLRVTNAAGCTNNTTEYVTITRPTVYVGGGQATLSSCASLMTNTFSTTSSEPLTITKWSFGDGGVSTDKNPTHTFKNNGSTYTVTVNYTTVNGCTGTSSFIQYPVYPPVPVSVYATGTLATCVTALTASFGINSSDPLKTLKWTFGDGSFSTDPAPTHTFTAIGKYTVRFDYTTQAGCTGTTFTSTLVVDPKIKVDFNPSPNPVCGNNAANFITTANISDINSYSWDFGDGGGPQYAGASTSHSFGAAGDYNVTLYARNIGGCDTSITKKITVKPPFAVLNGHSDPTCDGTRGDFTFTQSSVQASTVTWNFGDGSSATTPGNQTSIKHTYKKTGTYSVYLTATNGTCTLAAYDQNKVYVLVKQSPTLTGSKPSVCANGAETISIANLDRNPYQTDDNIYYYNYYSSYGIQAEQYRDLTAFNGYRSGGPLRWTTTYSESIGNFQSGEKDLRYILTSAVFGCQDTTNFMPLTVKGATGGFEVIADKLCYQSPVTLMDTSHSTADNPILAWQWNFGDGTFVTNKKGGTVTHVYTDPGYYNVSMQITDAAGCSSNIPYTLPVQVNGPKASFYPSGTDVHLNTNVSFYNTTNDYGNSSTVYSWNFGDGNTSSDPYPSHTYPIPGIYVVTMSASNPSLPCASVATPVTIIVRNFNPNFAFNTSFVSGSCAPELVSFTNTSSNYIRVTWDFGDGITADNVNYPSHIYQKPGKYIVTLFVYGYNGLTGTYIDSVFIKQPAATLAANPLEVCIGANVGLKAKGTDIAGYAWDFGDGTVSAAATDSSTHQYLVSGVYQPAVIVQDANGCATGAEAPATVTVRPNPVLTVTPSDPFLCKGSGISLFASGGDTYRWTPAAGLSNPSVANPYAVPAVSTTYTVRIADAMGCSDSGKVNLLVVPPGNLQLTPDTAICLGKSVQLAASGKTNYSWINETTGLSNTGIPNPIANPETTTVYSLLATDPHDCFPVNKNVTVTILSLPTVNAGNDVQLWAGENTTLTSAASPDVAVWSWSPASYLACSNCGTTLCTPLASTQYKLTVTNQNGCQASDVLDVKVDCEENKVAIPNAFTPNHDGINDVFAIRGISIIKHLVIFGRWGEKVFEKNNFIAGDRGSWWDGNYKGLDAPAGSYVYFVEMECATGGAFTRKGSVVLIR